MIILHSKLNVLNVIHSQKFETSVMRVKRALVFTPKRTMLNSSRWWRNLMQTKPLYPHSRGIVWRTTVRYNEPVKNTTPPPMEIDPETGLEIMHPTDYSGKNHILLHQWEYKSETFFKIRGSFTTSPSPFKGKNPVFVDKITLDGYAKFQYLHVYDKPRLIRISDTIGMDISTLFLPPNAYIDSLIKKYSSVGLD